MVRKKSSVRLPVLAALFIIPLAFLACGSEKTALPTAGPAPLPTLAVLTDGATADIGVRYFHQLYTHCGVRYADFDGRRWLADPVLTSNEGLSPPRGWGNPNDSGTMELVSKDRAMFLSHSGDRAFFIPAPEDYQFKLCL